MKTKSTLALTLLAAATLLAGCQSMGNKFSSVNWSKYSPPNPFESKPAGPEVTLTLENGAQVKFVITSKNAQLAEFTRILIERGYYNDQYIYRDVPGAFVLTGKARLSNRPTMAGPYVPKDEIEKLGDVGTGEVGLLVHVDGTVGPEFILRYGMMLRDQETQPQNVLIGKLTEGQDALEAAQKGDKVARVSVVRQPPLK